MGSLESGSSLAGKRILLVGGSSGAGRGIGLVLAAAGARIAFAARRLARVQAAAERAGGGAIALQCDVCDDASCAQVVESAAAKLGGIDALLYAPAITAISYLADADGVYWDRVLRTNVTGAALVTRAAVPHLASARGRAVYLSSVAARGPVWPGLGVYGASKAALDRMVEGWRAEHPEVLFTRLSIGPIASEREEEEDATRLSPGALAVMAKQVPIWQEHRLMRPWLPDTEIGAQIAAILAGDADVEQLVIQARW